MLNNFKIDGINAINFIYLDNDDLLKILQMRNDSRIAKWMIVDRKISKNEHFRFIDHLKTQKNQAYFALKNDANDILGVISLNDVDLYNKHTFIGIYANPDILHQHIGHRMMNVIKYISFDILSLRIIFAKCIDNNTTALRFYKKEGFIMCGTLPCSIKKSNTFLDMILLALTKD